MKSAVVLFSIVSFILAIVSSCSVPKDLTPDAHPNAVVYTSVINTLNRGNSAEANITDSVKAGAEVAKLRLEITAATPAEYIYIVYATDNGKFLPLPVPTTVNEYGTFMGGTASTYSLKVPKLSTFTIDVAVNVRNTNSALNDVYKIWITDSIGSFSMPAYNKILGAATINLMYRAASLADTYTAATVSLGSQSSRSYGSFLSTGAQMIAMDSSDYVRSPESADMRLVTLTGGKKDNNSSGLWLYSPADVTLANPAVSGQADFILPSGLSKTTYFDNYSGAMPFDSVNAAVLTALPVPAVKSIEVAKDGIYIFQTQEGKKGIIKIISTAATTNVGGIGSTAAQNASLVVKVLN